jgi:hypothetical protein
MTLTPSERARYVEAITIDVLVVRARLAAALDYIESNVGGYPATTVGAAPDTGNGTEADGRPRPDPAIVGRNVIDHLLGVVSRDVKELAYTVSGWYLPDTEAGRNADAQARQAVKQLRCENHHRHGIFEERATDRRNCRWCSDVEREYGSPPDVELIGQRAASGRLSSMHYAAFMRRVGTTKKAKRKGAA